MKKIRIIFIMLSLTFLLFVSASCIAQEKYHPGGPYYYGDFATYKIPFRPIEELTPSEAKTRDVYYLAYFNDGGEILSFTKYLKGKIEFSDKYIYDQSGILERRELTKSTGEVIIQYFDKQGRIIQKK